MKRLEVVLTLVFLAALAALALLAGILVYQAKGRKDAMREGGHPFIQLNTSTDKMSDMIHTGAYFQSGRCISLETNDSCLINYSRIAKVAHIDGFFYVADANTLYQFNEQGLLVRKISKRGGGPSEYISISDFEITPSKEVWILSRSGRALYHYTWDGVLKKRFPLDCWAERIHLLGNNRMLLYVGNEKDGQNAYQMRVIDLNSGKTVAEYMKIDPDKASYLHVHAENIFLDQPSGLLYYNLFDDMIYQIKDGIKPVYKVNLLDKNIPASFYRNKYKNVMVFFQELFRHDYAYGIGIFLKGQKNYLLSYYYNHQCRMALIDTESRQSIADFYAMKEDIKLLGYTIEKLPDKVYGNGDELILPLLPSEIVRSFNGEGRKQDAIKQVLHYTGEDQNPVLFVLKLK